MEVVQYEGYYEYNWYPDTIIYDPPIVEFDIDFYDESDEEQCSELMQMNDLT